jgi:hypothetical protein
VAAAAACAAAGAPAAAPLCAYVGGAVASAVADAVQTIGAAIFGGSDSQPEPNDTWNPVADKSIAGIVKALRIKQGKEVSAPPGGSFRNYPEWNVVAVAWARHVNDFVKARGGPVKWFYDSPQDADPGRVRGAAVGQWEKCGVPQEWGGDAGQPICTNMSTYLPEATVRATQQTAQEFLAPKSSGGLLSSSTSTAVVGAGALGLLLWWWLR